MFFKMIKKDFLRKKTISIALLLFIMLSVFSIRDDPWRVQDDPNNHQQNHLDKYISGMPKPALEHLQRRISGHVAQEHIIAVK